MIVDNSIFRDYQEILPKGDSYKLPPGRRQYSLRSLLWLVSIFAIVAGTARSINLSTEWIVVLEIYVASCWWAAAEIREKTTPSSTADQTALREEVRQWLEQRQQNGQ